MTTMTKLVLINHLFAFSGVSLPPFDTSMLFEYIVAANGVFIRAEKPGLKVLLKVQPMDTIKNAVRGLDALTEYVEVERMPAGILENVMEQSEYALPNEMLFYVQETADSWELTIPEQRASRVECAPINPDDPAARRALVEIHSHGNLNAFFSHTDNQEEAFGFRIFCVIGTPSGGDYGFSNGKRLWEMCCRIGVYGHFVEVPAEWLFKMLPCNVMPRLTMVEIAGVEVMYDIPDLD